MIWFRNLCMAAFAVLLGIGISVNAQAFTGQKYSKQARISLEQARSIAQKAVPGQIAKEELEKEKGGSGLRYSFDIKSNGVTHEVGVDAKSGKILESSLESKEKERKEKD